MHNLSQRYGKLLSVGLSVICSVFLVAVIVSAATTIGLNISTGGTLSVTGASTLGNASSSRLSSFLWFGAGGTATTTIDSAGNLSVAGTVSSTLASAFNGLYAGTTATTTIKGTATSTFGDSVNPVTNDRANLGWPGVAWRSISASGTLTVGGRGASSTIDFRTHGAIGNGTCIVLTGGNGTVYYISVTSTGVPLVADTASCL